MTDRELLELAAKAAELSHWEYVENDYRDGKKVFGYYNSLLEVCWNPLTDDGDALRLVRFLQMTIAHEPSRGGWSVGAVVNGEFRWLAHDDDLRCAIVRAAAEIGKEMK